MTSKRPPIRIVYNRDGQPVPVTIPEREPASVAPQTISPARKPRAKVLTRVLPPIRCSPVQEQRWQRAAALEPELDFSEWVRRELDQAADFALRQKP